MTKYLFYIFHTAIISLFLFGCGYKADPKWIGDKNTTENNNTEYNLSKIKQ